MGKKDRERIDRIKAGLGKPKSSRMLSPQEIEARLKLYSLEDYTGTPLPSGLIRLHRKRGSNGR